MGYRAGGAIAGRSSTAGFARAASTGTGVYAKPSRHKQETEGRAMTPAGLRGVANDAIAVYFADAALAAGFVAHWCRGCRAEAVEASSRVRDDAPRRRRNAPQHQTPGGGR
jgi:hypothetical protein